MRYSANSGANGDWSDFDITSFYPLGELARRLDGEFDVARYVELDGWDFSLSPEEKASLLSHASPMFRDTFNGLLLSDAEDERPVGRVYFAVFPTVEMVDRVLAEQAQFGERALPLSHHSLTMHMRGYGFVAIPEHQLEALRAAEVALCVAHAPLDCHPTISTIGAIADSLHLRRTGVFGHYVAGYAGVIGEQAPE